MRNCFIPHCDQLHKGAAHQKRMMFRPPRAPELFERWRAALPKHRPLKAIDRVCEHHFQPGDIQTTWDHIIGGRLVQMERTKAALLPLVVPSLRLGDAAGDDDKSNGRAFKRVMATATTQPQTDERQQRRTAKRQRVAVHYDNTADSSTADSRHTTITQQQPASDDDDVSAPDRNAPGDTVTLHVMHADDAAGADDGGEHDWNVLIMPEELASGVRLVAATDTAPDTAPEAPAESAAKHDDADDAAAAAAADDTHTDSDDDDADAEDADEAFDALYDDVFEVELPDTMYGIHRDPERTFVVFTRFDAALMRCTRALRVDRRGARSSRYVDGVQRGRRVAHGARLSVELVTAQLAELDSI